MSDSLRPRGLELTRLFCPWEFSRQEYWRGLPRFPPRDLPNVGIKPRSPALQADSLPSEPPGKPKDTGMGSLSLLQGIFPTQESNQGLLHCRRILYQLSYQGSLFISLVSIISNNASFIQKSDWIINYIVVLTIQPLHDTDISLSTFQLLC